MDSIMKTGGEIYPAVDTTFGYLTRNQAERSIAMVKIQQEITGMLKSGESIQLMQSAGYVSTVKIPVCPLQFTGT